MESTLAFRGLETLQANSKSSIELTEFASKDYKAMLSLTVKAHKDAKTLKTITILTMFYLPASFAAVSLPMKFMRQLVLINISNYSVWATLQ